MPEASESTRLKSNLMVVRTDPKLSAALARAAKTNGRSKTQEIESRLERLFTVEELEAGAQTSLALHEIGLSICALEAGTGTSWQADAKAWSEVSNMFRAMMEARRPERVNLLGQRSTAWKGVARAINFRISIRCSAELKAKLDQAASRGGRSLSAEIEQRLERTFEREMFKDYPQTTAFIHLLGASISDLEARTGKSWLTDSTSWHAVADIVHDELEKRRPKSAEIGDGIAAEPSRSRSRSPSKSITNQQRVEEACGPKSLGELGGKL